MNRVPDPAAEGAAAARRDRAIAARRALVADERIPSEIARLATIVRDEFDANDALAVGFVVSTQVDACKGVSAYPALYAAICGRAMRQEAIEQLVAQAAR